MLDGVGAGSAGAYGSSQGVRDVVGSLMSSISMADPTEQEQQAIMQGLFPDLAPLLPSALLVLHIVKQASGQGTSKHVTRDTEGLAGAVARALAAGGVRAGDVALHVGRHFSIRDLIVWCKRMQVR